MKKGYTLVELLAVLALLATIIGLVAINAIEYSNERLEKDYENIKLIMVDNSKILVESTSKSITKTIDNNLQTNTSCKITFSDLVNNNLMNSETKNPKTNEVLSSEYVKVTLDSSTYKYSYEYKETDEPGLVNCIN